MGEDANLAVETILPLATANGRHESGEAFGLFLKHPLRPLERTSSLHVLINRRLDER